MAKAVWNGVTLAESSATIVVEGNHYFPPDSIHRDYFRDSDAQTVCGWKGTASYFDVAVDDDVNTQAAWVSTTARAKANAESDAAKAALAAVALVSSRQNSVKTVASRLASRCSLSWPLGSRLISSVTFF